MSRAYRNLRQARLAIVLLALAATGCATVVQPQQAVTDLNARSPRYNSQECVQARQIALAYDDNISGRMGLGLGLGLLLGPFGLPFAIAADMSQKEKRDAVLGELSRHCEGPVSSGNAVAASDAEARIEILNELHKKGLLTDAEYAAKKSQVVDSMLSAKSTSRFSPPDAANIIGAQIRLRDMDPFSRSANGEIVITFDSSSESGISLNDGTIVLDGTGRVTRGSMTPPYVYGIAGKQLEEGSVVNGKFRPSSGAAIVDATVRVKFAETVMAGTKEIRVLRSSINGYAGGAPFSGEILVEPLTGLILKADIKSGTRPFVLREFVR